jgi:hypothetical protein
MRAEWLRLRSGRAPLLLPLAALLAAAYALALGVAVDAGVMGARSGFYLGAAACSGAALGSAIVGALAAASAVAADQASGVLRTALLRPLDRGAWLAGRLGALGVGLGAVFACASIGAIGAGLIRFGLRGVWEGDYLIAGGGFLAGQLLAALGLSLLAQLAAVALGGAVGTLLGRPGAAAVVTALVGMVLGAATRWPRAQPFLLVGAVTSSLDRVAQLAQGIAGHHVGDGAPATVAICLAWMAAGVVLAAATLARRDVVT